MHKSRTALQASQLYLSIADPNHAMGVLLAVARAPLIFYFLLLCRLMNKCQGLNSDGQALVNFRTTIVSSDGMLREWRTEDPDPCGWKGVTCDSTSKRVVSLNLSNHKISGPISPDIGKLDRLRFLDLHHNNFFGAIPPELGNCAELQGLFLRNNYLSELIPPELGKLSKLQTLDVSGNLLIGSIPTSLGNLRSLSNFNVSNNFLVGPIPSNCVLDRFGNNTFRGNCGLCWEDVNKLCEDVEGSAGALPICAGSLQELVLVAPKDGGGRASTRCPGDANHLSPWSLMLLACLTGFEAII